MKKNFFKKLAFVLAFAMVFTTLAPAASAFAATKPALSAKSKTLLLNEEGRTKFNFDVKSKVKGSTYKWTTSDKAVVTVNKSGVATAKKIGTAKVTVAIKLATGKTTKLSATVTVKENMDTITVTNVPKEAIAIGATNNFNRDYTTVTGGKSTDITRWEVTKGADKASIDNSGKFVATAAGEYTVVARSFQSKAKYAEYLAGDASVVTAESAPVTVKVQASITKIVQTTTKKMEIYFNADMSKVVTKDNLVIETNDTAKQRQVVEEVKFDAADAGLKATVTTYLEFKDATEYKFTVVDNANLNFVKKASNGEPTHIKITGPLAITFDEFTTLNVAVYDANGVDVGGDDDVTLELTAGSENGYLVDNDADGDTEAYISEKGKSITVKATYDTNKLDANYNTIKFTDEAVITATDATLVVAANKYTVATKEPAWDTAFTPNTKIGTYDGAYTLYVQIKLPSSDDKISSAVEGYNFKFESMDETKLLVGENSGKLTSYGTGTAYVKVTYKNYAPILIPITVGAERKAATWAFDTTTLTVSNSSLYTDVATASAIVKDNYGVAMEDNLDLADVEFEQITSGVGPTLAKAIVNDKVVYTVTNAAGIDDKTYKFKVKYDNLVQYINVIVKDGTGAVTHYGLALKGSTNLVDAVRTDANNGAETVKVALFGYNKYNNIVSEVAASDYTLSKTSGPETVTSGSAIAGGIKVVSGSAVFNLTDTDGIYVKQAKIGGYQVKAVYNGKPYSVGFTVKNSQTVPVVVQEDVTVDASTVLEALEDSFRFTVGNDTLDEDAAFDFIVGGTFYDGNGNVIALTDTVSDEGRVVVKKIKVAQNFNGNLVVNEIDLSKYIIIDK